MIEIKNLSINFGKNEILKDINLEFKQGETLAFWEQMVVANLAF